VHLRRVEGAAAVRLCGVGESSDGYHISAPDPSGRGAETAIRAALAQAGALPEAVGYVNLHGTATPKNDEMESQVMARVFGLTVPCSSTKSLVGHTLGAAGALELGFCWLLLPMRTSSDVFPRRHGTVHATGICRRSTSSATAFCGSATCSCRIRSRSVVVTPPSRWGVPDMDCSGIPIGELLPHGPEMTVIDRLVEYNPQRSIATVVVTEQSPFFVRSGVPAWSVSNTWHRRSPRMPVSRRDFA